jgi:glycosyltransferase involved in cell wall biosynthesis
MYKIFKLFKVRTVLRVDGFSYPELYTNKDYENLYRRNRDFSMNRIKTNFEIQLGLKFADHVIYQSLFSKLMADRYLYNRNKDFSVIYNGVDIEAFKPDGHKVQRKFVMSIHGNMRDTDILNCSLKLFEMLFLSESFEFYKSINLMIIGTMTPDVKKLYEDICRNSSIISQHSRAYGAVDKIQLAQLLPTSDLSIHLMSGDACPNAVLESMACGVPILCQSFGGQAELAGEAGIVVQSEGEFDYSKELIKSCHDKLLLNSEGFNNLKFKARKRAEDYFSLEIMGSKYQDVLNKNIKNNAC